MTGEIEVRLTEDFEIPVAGPAGERGDGGAGASPAAGGLGFREVADIDATDTDAEVSDIGELPDRHDTPVAARVHAVRERGHARDLFDAAGGAARGR